MPQRNKVCRVNALSKESLKVKLAVAWGRALPRLAIERGIAAAAKARRAQTQCKRDHPLSGENLFITQQGSRGCKECRKIHKQTYRSKTSG